VRPRGRLLLATTSAKKIAELRQILFALPLDLVTPLDLGLDMDPEETGSTFEENAQIKAQAFARASGLPSLADDSGLEVDALGGDPGVHSKRYAGPSATDADRIALLLQRLHDIPDERRTARFRCVMALATPESVAGTVEGTCEGHIAHSPRGAYGFGYDPIFVLPDTGRTMAELSAEEKNLISHRGRAGLAARRLIENWLASAPTQGASPFRSGEGDIAVS
jgi:XTP/dITP diphosphohydrolase